MAAVRGGALPELNIVAHSYGTTTAAAALSLQGVRVKNFIALGSAGLPDSIRSVADLNADNVFAGHARTVFPWEDKPGDKWGDLGRLGSRDHHVSPTGRDFGSTVFGVDTGGEAGRPVTDHDALMGDGDRAGYLDAETESLENAARAITGATDQLTPGAPSAGRE